MTQQSAENLKKIAEAKKNSIQDWEDFWNDMADDEAYGFLSKEDASKVTDLVAEAIEAIENEETDKVNEARAKIEQIYNDAAAKTNQEKQM